MIYDNIRNAKFYNDSNLQKVFDVFKQVIDTEFPTQRITIDGDNVYVNPVVFTSKSIDEGIYEAHVKYIDVHFCVEGTEVVYLNDVDNLMIQKAYVQENDIAFYEGNSKAFVVLNAGDFLVCYPNEAHMVGINNGENAEIKKLVAKVIA